VQHAGQRQWLARPGTLGRSLDATIHICDDAGNELPPGENGRISFGKAGPRFSRRPDVEPAPIGAARTNRRSRGTGSGRGHATAKYGWQ
jgi:hypothetical protein